MKSSHYHYIAIIVFLLIGLFFVFGITHVGDILNYVHKNPSKDFMNNIGTFGDSAGLLNALFSALAFGGVILTIFWQISENKKQRDDEHRIQFESVFFNMTNTLEHIVSELKVKRGADNVGFAEGFDDWNEEDGKGEGKATEESLYVKGREVFKYLYEERQPSIPQIVKEYGIKGYEGEMTGVFDSYFRYLYRILKYIDDSKLISHDVKYQYAGILRAHLSYMELTFIYYNCLSMFGREKMKPLVERYHLLKNIRYEKLHDQVVNAPIEGLKVNDMYDNGAWESDKKQESERNPLNILLWRMFLAFMFAIIFDVLFGDAWHKHVVSKWVDISSNILDGVYFLLILMNAYIFRYLNSIFEKAFEHMEREETVNEVVWRLICKNWIMPYFLFMLITSHHINRNFHIVWFGYMDIFIIFLPLIVSVAALIWNILKLEQK